MILRSCSNSLMNSLMNVNETSTLASPLVAIIIVLFQPGSINILVALSRERFVVWNEKQFPVVPAFDDNFLWITPATCLTFSGKNYKCRFLKSTSGYSNSEVRTKILWLFKIPIHTWPFVYEMTEPVPEYYFKGEINDVKRYLQIKELHLQHRNQFIFYSVQDRHPKQRFELELVTLAFANDKFKSQQP